MSASTTMTSITNKISSVADVVRTATSTDAGMTIKEMADAIADLDEYATDISAAFIEGTITVLDTKAITTVADYCCWGMESLTEVNLPNCTSIGSYAFYYLSELTSVSLGACETIGKYAFFQDIALKSLTISTSTMCELESPTALYQYSDEYVEPMTQFTLYVPSDLVDTYKADSNWSAFADQIVAIEE